MLSQDFLERCVYPAVRHEAAHWLAAYLYGWGPRVIGIGIPESENTHHSYVQVSHSVQMSSIENVIDYTRKRLVILYAGMYAQHFDGCSFDNQAISNCVKPDGGSYSDFWKAEEIYFFYYNCLQNPAGWEVEFRPIVHEVKNLVITNNWFLEKVAREIGRRATHIGQEILVQPEELISMYENK